MNENEQLARWLGMKPDKMDFDIQGKIETFAIWRRENGGAEYLPNFRASNEFAGELLEKLGNLNGTNLDGYTVKATGEKRWRCIPLEGYRSTWRDAVVDATLEIIKREEKWDLK